MLCETSQRATCERPQGDYLVPPRQRVCPSLPSGLRLCWHLFPCRPSSTIWRSSLGLNHIHIPSNSSPEIPTSPIIFSPHLSTISSPVDDTDCYSHPPTFDIPHSRSCFLPLFHTFSSSSSSDPFCLVSLSIVIDFNLAHSPDHHFHSKASYSTRLTP